MNTSFSQAITVFKQLLVNTNTVLLLKTIFLQTITVFYPSKQLLADTNSVLTLNSMFSQARIVF